MGRANRPRGRAGRSTARATVSSWARARRRSMVEEYEHAKSRGAHIYAEVLGYSLNNDAFHMTTPLPDGSVRHRGDARRAFDDARLRPEEIDYVNAHASSTAGQRRDGNARHQDRAGRPRVQESRSAARRRTTRIRSGRRGRSRRSWPRWPSSAAGCPRRLHHEEPDPACDLDIVPNKGRDVNVRRLLSNSFGFGGINSCLVLGSV